ncbi:MAG: bifunctional demethylmenaquinone methyltransferase/2-methoxy-6-polyprenyl-1,4-benzoquinol methylase UbiE [Bacteroidia bacterium]
MEKSITEVKPDQDSVSSKKEQVEKMFDSIAVRYDFLNRFLSLGIDRGWRKKAIHSLKEIHPKQILDVATGTGDLAIATLKLNPEKVTGVDISEAMLLIGREKIKKLDLQHKIELMKDDSENLHFGENTFDAVTVAFGVRNFENLQRGLNEMFRVLRPGGKAAILEFSKPRSFPFKQIYHFYFTLLLPLFGRMISKSKNAYSYLPESVKHFPDGQNFADYLSNSGFRDIKIQPLTFGICTLYTAIK